MIMFFMINRDLIGFLMDNGGQLKKVECSLTDNE